MYRRRDVQLLWKLVSAPTKLKSKSLEILRGSVHSMREMQMTFAMWIYCLKTSLKFTINWSEWRTCVTKPQQFHRLFHDMLGLTLFVCSSGHATRMSTVHRHQQHYFFSSLPHDNNPPRYDFLGDFKDELAEDNFITEFASRGPKHGYLTKKEKNAMQGESH